MFGWYLQGISIENKANKNAVKSPTDKSRTGVNDHPSTE
jgi:hypothetical protein